jgi:hypothetical protein
MKQKNKVIIPYTYRNLININLEEHNTGELGAELLKFRRNHPARTAPDSGEVDNNLQRQI